MPQPVKGLPAGAVVRPLSGVPQGAIVRPIGSAGQVDDTPEAPQQSGISRAWQAANKPIADFALGDGASSDFLTSAATGMGRNDLRSASREINTATHDWSGGTSPEDESFLQRLNPVRQLGHVKAALGDPNSPEAQSFRTGTLGAMADTADTASSFTSPLSIATYGLGAVAQGARGLNAMGKVGKLGEAAADLNTAARVAPKAVAALAPAARVGGGLTGAGFAANAVSNMGGQQPGESEADTLGRNLNAAGMFFGGVAGAGHAVKGEAPSLGSNMADRPNEGGGTRGDVYKYARDNGIDMNLAQAGEGKFARNTETLAENTLGGSGRMAKMKDQQQAQVDQHINNIKDKLDPYGKGKDAVQQGELVQRAADVAADVSRTNAASKYDDLDNMATPTIKGGVSLMRDELVDRRPIKQQAQVLYDQLNKGNVNSVKPTEAMNVLKSVIDGPDYSSFGDAHADRSNLNNAHFTDAVSKGKGERALSILSKSFKDQMAQSAQDAEAAGMKGAIKKYNEAQKAWSDHMAVFGDNSSPIVKAIQQKEPGKILDTFLNNSSGGSVRAMRQMSEVAPAFKGLLKRELVNRLTANDPTYKNFNARLSKYSEPFLKELFKPEELDNLRKTGQVTKSLNLDVNPSGSGKYGVSAALASGPLFEIGHSIMHGDPAGVAAGVGGLGAMAGGSNVAARVLGHQGLTDKLMGYEPDTAAPAITKPGFAATAAQAPQQQPQGKTIANPFGQPTGKGLSNPARRRAGNNPQAGFATPAAMLDLASGGVSLIAKKIRDVISKPDTAAGKMANALDKNDGFTYNLGKGDQFGKDSFAVSIFPERQEVHEKQPTKKVIAQYIDKNKDILGSEQGDKVHIGGWKGSDGKWYLDLSASVPDLATARAMGKKYNQQSIFDLKSGKEIATGGKVANDELLKGANAYNEKAGLPKIQSNENLTVDDRAKQIADAYEKMEHNPDDPAVKKSYDALKKEVSAQWDHATGKMGIKFEPWTGEGQPYKNSAEMTKDVTDNKHLYFFRGGEMPADHPMGDDAGEGLTFNDKFRAVHDLFGHAKDSNQFGPRGEENAWNRHKQMFSADAIPAMTTETKGQNSWVNYGPHGEENRANPANTRYADQKAGLLPSEFHSRPGESLADRLKGIKEAQYLDAVHYTNNPDLKELDPAFAGKGPFAGAERSRTDKVPSTYLGERGVYNEPRVQRSSARYAADINSGRLYDMKADPEGLMKQVSDGKMTFSDAEKKAKSYGYSGLRDPEQGLITSWDKVGDIRREMPEPKGSSVELIKNPRKLDNGATISDMAKVLEQHTKANLKPLKVGDAPDADVVSRAADLAESEIKYQLASESNHGQDWYKGDVKKMEDAVAKIHPEIGKDADKTSMFKAITTAMSLGNDGDATIKQALEAYDRYKKDGSVPLERSPGEPWGGQYPGNNRAALENIQKLVTKFGEKGAVKWLSETHPVDEIEKVKDNKSPLTVPMGMREVPGSFIMGPKAGPFYQNLNGDFSHLTADVWFNRSWNRWMGTMFDKNGEPQSVARSPRERRLQVEAFKTVADRLKMSVAEAQAVMWYYEQRLYTQHGLDSHSGSYGDAAERITKQLRDTDTGASAEAAQAGTDAETGSVSDSGGSSATEVRGPDHEGEGDTSFDFSPRTGQRTPDHSVTEASEDDVKSLANWSAKPAGDVEQASRYRAAAKIAQNIAKSKMLNGDKLFVVKEDGKVLGVAKVDVYRSPDRTSPVTIDYLATHPDAQGKGVGKQLIQHTINVAAKEGRGIELLSKSGARSFYEGLGFELAPRLGDSFYQMTPGEVAKRATGSK